MPLPITALYGALLGLLLVALAIPVVLQRRRHRVGMGTGENKDLERTVRAHGNAAEYIPIALILMALLEMNSGERWFLHLCGAAFFLSRILHAWGLALSRGVSFGRFYGTAISWIVIVALAVANLLRLFPAAGSQ